MDSTKLFSKDSEMSSCIQKIRAEYNNRIFTDDLLIDITAMQLYENGIVAGTNQGNVYLVNTENLVSMFIGKGHEGHVKAICILSEGFITGGEDCKLVLWKGKEKALEQVVQNPITSILYEDHLVWIFDNTSTCMQWNHSLTTYKNYLLNDENIRNTELMNFNGIRCLIFTTQTSIEFWNIKRCTYVETLEIPNTLCFCVLVEYKALAFTDMQSGIWIWKYGDSLKSMILDSEGIWTQLLYLSGGILVSAGTCKKDYFLKFWNIVDNDFIFEILLEHKPVYMLTDPDELNLFVALEGGKMTKIILKRKMVNHRSPSDFPVNDIEVHLDKVITVGDRSLKFQSEFVEFEGTISCCKISGNQLIIAEDTVVKLVNMEKFTENSAVMSNKFPVKSMDFANFSQWIVVVCRQESVSEIAIFDLLENDLVYLQVDIYENVYEARVVRNMLVYTTDKNIWFVPLGPGKPRVPVKEKIFARAELKLIVNSAETALFCAGNNGIIDIIEVGDIDKNNPSIFRGISKSFHTSEDSISVIAMGVNEIFAIALNSSETFLIISRTKARIQFWNIEDQLLIWTLNLEIVENITRIRVSGSFIYLNAKLEVLEIKDPTYQVSREKNNSADLSESIIESKEEFFVLGPNTTSICFLGVVCNLRSNRPECNRSLYNWVVFPGCVNMLHFFTYIRDCRLVKSAFEKNCPFIRMTNHYSALSIALDYQNKELIEVIASQIAQISANNPQIISRIEQDLPQLNSVSPPSLSNIYSLAYQISKQPKLKKYGILKNTKGMKATSQSYLVKQDDFLDKSNTDTKDETNLVYRVSSFRMNFALGNESGIKFLESLCNCTDNDTFATQLIQDFVLYKWNKAKYYIYLYNVLYFMYAGAILHCTSEGTFDGYWMLVVFLLNTLFLVYECFQMSLGSKSYVKNLWNSLDLIRILFGYTYLALCYCIDNGWLDGESEFYQAIVLILVGLTLLRGLSIFECYSETRTIIKIFFEIIKDAKYFLSVFISSNLAFAFLFIILSYNGDKPLSLVEGINLTYNINFGGFDTSGFDFFGFICFHLCTLVNPLLMLNLLVSIMNETFSQLKENLVTEDIKALAEMITEIESVMVWRKNIGSQEFLQGCSPEGNTVEVVDKRNAKLKMLSDEVAGMYTRVKDLEKFCKAKNEEFISKVSKIRQEEITLYKRLNKDEGDFRSAIEKIVATS